MHIFFYYPTSMYSVKPNSEEFKTMDDTGEIMNPDRITGNLQSIKHNKVLCKIW